MESSCVGSYVQKKSMVNNQIKVSMITSNSLDLLEELEESDFSGDKENWSYGQKNNILEDCFSPR